MKELVFLGDSLERLRDFPEAARKEAGVQLHKVQQGLEPSDWKPMASVGQGMREIRIRDEAGAFRVLYITRIEDAVLCCMPSRRSAADGQTRSGRCRRTIAANLAEV